MSDRKILIRLLLTACVVPLSYAEPLTDNNQIRIFLSAEKCLSANEIPSGIIELGQVAIMLGQGPEFRKAQKVSLGEFAYPGQQIRLDRQTILSRLASEGIHSKDVAFNGAEMTVVSQDAKCITAAQFQAAARDYLQNSLKDMKIESLKPLRPAKDYPVEVDVSEIQLVARLIDRQAGGTARVRVWAMHQGVELTQQDVFFSIQYACRRWVASRDLPVGTEISLDNVEVETYASPVPEQAGLTLPYGMMTRHPVLAGAPIKINLLEPKEMPVLVKRRQKVILKIDTGALVVTAQGEALDDGKTGDVVRVQRGSRRTNDERIVIGKVMSDGTVEPVI